MHNTLEFSCAKCASIFATQPQYWIHDTVHPSESTRSLGLWKSIAGNLDILDPSHILPHTVKICVKNLKLVLAIGGNPNILELVAWRLDYDTNE